MREERRCCRFFCSRRLVRVRIGHIKIIITTQNVRNCRRHFGRIQGMTFKACIRNIITILCIFIRCKIQRIAQSFHRRIVFFVCIRERSSKICKDVVFTSIRIFSIVRNIHRERTIVHRRSDQACLFFFSQDIVFIFPERIERIHIVNTTETGIALSFLAKLIVGFTHSLMGRETERVLCKHLLVFCNATGKILLACQNFCTDQHCRNIGGRCSKSGIHRLESGFIIPRSTFHIGKPGHSLRTPLILFYSLSERIQRYSHHYSNGRRTASSAKSTGIPSRIG